MYTSEKSTKLTLGVTYLAAAILAFLMIFAAPVARHILGDGEKTAFHAAVTAFYICCPAGWLALYSIRKILKNVLSDTVFTTETVRLLRQLSWHCAFVAAVSFITIFFCRIFFTFTIGAAFMTLILRVLKNVMAKAVEIKEENELTI